MCGIAGILNPPGKHIEEHTLRDMVRTISHRGPDDEGIFLRGHAGFAFKRLSIVDLTTGNQPFYNEDKTVVLICNGEIYNHKQLRSQLEGMGYHFKTCCDVEVIVYLYEAYGTTFLNKLNGQFAFCLYDQKKELLFLARDHFGIAPLFYSIQRDTLLFASEIKALLTHPSIQRRVNLTGLDQLITFPGMVSPVTMFEGVKSLKPGHFLLSEKGKASVHEFWDLTYITEDEEKMNKHVSEQDYIDQLHALLIQSVKYRLQADVPVGYYVSGGLDSSLIAAIGASLSPSVKYNSFSILFEDQSMDERSFQRLMAERLGSIHHEYMFTSDDIASRLKTAIYHAECPLKETYNTCSLALSETVNKKNIKVVLSGEGADEFFAGYVGYRFDQKRAELSDGLEVWQQAQEDEVRFKLWGDASFLYEKQYASFDETKLALYAEPLREKYSQFHSIREDLIDKQKLTGRSKLHKRSYIDFKLRVADHLVSDHGDRVSYANSVEARYPFLDIDLVNFLRKVPSQMKLNGFTEKYILKKCAQHYLPSSIIHREKFSFVAPGSKSILQKYDWVNDILSSDTIRRQGYFDVTAVERLKKMYMAENFVLNTTFETDLLLIVVTFGIFLELFDLPGL